MTDAQTDPNKPTDKSRMWFVRMSTGAVFGPVNTTGLAQWAAEGRIMPDDEVSDEARKSWKSAQDIPEVGMDLLVERPDGSMMGPFHPDAIKHLIEEGKIPPNGKTFPKHELKARLASRQMSLFSNEELPASEIAKEPPKNHKQKQKAETNSAVSTDNQEKIIALTAKLDEMRKSAVDVAGEHNREVATLRAEIDSLHTQLDTAIAAKDEAIKKSDDTCSTTAGLQNELSTLRAEIDSLHTQLDTAIAAKDEAIKKSDDTCSTKAGLQNELSTLRAEIDSLHTQLDAAIAAKDKAIKKSDDTCSTTAGLQNELSTLRGEYSALLEYSNSRDAEYSANIAKMHAEQISSNTIHSSNFDPGSVGRIQELEQKLADAYKDLDSAKTALKSAESNIEEEPIQLNTDAEKNNLKQFAEAALITLQNVLDREIKADNDARSDCKNRIDLLTSDIEKLRNLPSILKSDKTMLERAEHRNEMLISRLRQELESERSLHKSEQERFSDKIRELEKKSSLLEKSEAIARGQLELVQKNDTGTSLDSIESQLRRRESTMLEMERNFEKERQNWQSTHDTLIRRIEDLESSSKVLATNQQKSAPTCTEEINKRKHGWISILHK